MLVDKIYKYLNSKNKAVDESVLKEALGRFESTIKRQFMESKRPSSGSLYPSLIGKSCARQIAYKYHGFKQDKQVSPRGKIGFFLGDLAELGILALGKLAGVDIGLSQEYLEIDFAGITMHGYPDGLVYNGNDSYVVEVKSKTPYGFKAFERDGVDNRWGYRTQISLYMEALGMDECLFVVLNKSTGKLAERIVKKDNKALDRARENIETINNGDPKSLPERFVDFDDCKFMTRKKCWELPVECSYCNWHKTCWGEAMKIETISGKPKCRVYKEKWEAKT